MCFPFFSYIFRRVSFRHIKDEEAFIVENLGMKSGVYFTPEPIFPPENPSDVNVLDLWYILTKLFFNSGELDTRQLSLS